MAYKFEDKFVRFRWSDELKGKKVFYADDISCLEEDVAEGKDRKELLGKSDGKLFPFTIKDDDLTNLSWKFIYYDPNYDVKLAYEEGKQIQFKLNDGHWRDIHGEPAWSKDTEYRINPVKTGLKWTDLEVGDVIETAPSAEGNIKAMVTAIDYTVNETLHILACGRWIDNEELKFWRKVNVDE